MTYRPQFKRYFHTEIVPEQGVFLLSEKENYLLEGSTYIQLHPLLNGEHSEEEIINFFQDQSYKSNALQALEFLKRQGIVVNGSTSMPLAQAAFWDMVGINPKVATKRLENTTVSVVAIGQIDPSPLKTILESLGVSVGEQGQFRVVLTDDYLQEGLDRINQASLSDKRPWMLVKPVGIEMWVGPIFVPGETGCWRCLAHRLRGHRKIERYLQHYKKSKQPFPTALSTLPSTLQTALGFAATEIVKWVVLGQSDLLKGQVVSLNLLSLEKQSHILTVRPQCSDCGVFINQFSNLKLQPRKKSLLTDSGRRILSAQETFKKLRHHLSPITGLISRMLPTGNHDAGLAFSYLTDPNFVYSQKHTYSLRSTLRSFCSGKGRSDIQAKVSALCESIERYSGVFQGNEVRIRATLNALGSAAVHPNACMLFSSQQFANREQWNQMRQFFSWVPVPFDKEMEIEWSPVWSLTHEEVRYVPTAYCYYGYWWNGKPQFTRADSNGCAAGNCKEEAILQGFLELVERDSVALWWYNRLRSPRVDLSSFDEPYFHQLQTYHQRRHRELWVLDISSDLNIPVFAAISRRNDKETEDIIFGFGAHFDPKIAILRALTEHEQLLSLIFSNQANNGPAKSVTNWYLTATISNQPYLSPDKRLTQKVKADYCNFDSDDLYTDVMKCVQIAKEKGLETLVLDQSRPDTGLHVAKVIVPGLRHFWARFAPGRLYQVPVQMGILPSALNEENLNPNLMFV